MCISARLPGLSLSESYNLVSTPVNLDWSHDSFLTGRIGDCSLVWLKLSLEKSCSFHLGTLSLGKESYHIKKKKNSESSAIVMLWGSTSWWMEKDEYPASPQRSQLPQRGGQTGEKMPPWLSSTMHAILKEICSAEPTEQWGIMKNYFKPLSLGVVC